MKRKSVIQISVFVVLLSFLIGSTGVFRLAIGSSEAGIKKDRLVGVFVTYEYLDLFDHEAYIKDNADKLLSGKKIIEEDTSKYNGRLYAKLVEKKLTAERTGETTTMNEYVFDGIEGSYLYVAEVADEAGNHVSVSSSDNDAIIDGHVDISTADDAENVSITGTIYVSALNGRRTFYINPVYQEHSGKLYATAGNGVSQGGDLADGMKHSMELKEETTAMINGRITSCSSRVEVTIAYILPPEKIIITQLNADNKVLSSKEYTPGLLPDEINVDTGTGYIIVEVCKKAADGSIITEREIYQAGNEYLSAFYCREDGICVKQSSRINWK